MDTGLENDIDTSKIKPLSLTARSEAFFLSRPADSHLSCAQGLTQTRSPAGRAQTKEQTLLALETLTQLQRGKQWTTWEREMLQGLCLAGGDTENV